MARVLTFLFTDVEGSTRLWEDDPEAMAVDLATHDALLRAAIEDHGGRVFTTAGDAFAAAFEHPRDALAAAIRGQRDLATASWSTSGLRVRMALHAGVAEERDGDFFGPPLNRTARLLSAGHGQQILVSGAARQLLGQQPAETTFVPLGTHRLKDLDLPEEIHQIVVDGLPTSFPTLKTLESVPNNLPSRFSSFVGRRHEMDQVRELVITCRLVTITGPGGVGKSRLALEAGARLADGFDGGVWLVELAPLTEPEVLVAEVAGQLRLALPMTSDPVAALAAQLRDRALLLVLDNCEHLSDDVARLVRAVLEGAPHVRVLATSRRPLGLLGEAVWTLPPLDVPDPGEGPRHVTDAVRLFLERVPASAGLGAGDLVAVQELCRRLDGLPLAIELAAARCGSLALGELDRRLDDRFRLLRTKDPTALPHQRTLLATVDWSYDLLPEAERSVYRRLSVFRTSFDLAAAEAVGVPDGIDPEDVVDALDGLVASSLLLRDATPAGDRYRMLETMRQHGARLLDGHGQRESASTALLTWAVALAGRAGSGIQGPEQQRWVDQLVLDVDNLRGALAWALHHDQASGLKLCVSLSTFWWIHGVDRAGLSTFRSTSYLAEGAGWAKAMLAAAPPDVPAKLRARAQMSLGGMLQIRLGEDHDALERLREAREIFAAGGDRRSEGWAHFYTGAAGWGTLPSDELFHVFATAQALFASLGDVPAEAFAEIMLTGVLLERGELDEAEAHHERIAELVESAPVPNLVAHAADIRALHSGCAGHEADPADLALAIEGFLGLGQMACLAHTAEAVALSRLRGGDLKAAAKLVGIAAGMRDRLGMVVPAYERARTQTVEEAGLAGMEPAARAAAFGAGRAMDLDTAVATIRTLAQEV